MSVARASGAQSLLKRGEALVHRAAPAGQVGRGEAGERGGGGDEGHVAAAGRAVVVGERADTGAQPVEDVLDVAVVLAADVVVDAGAARQGAGPLEAVGDQLVGAGVRAAVVHGVGADDDAVAGLGAAACVAHDHRRPHGPVGAARDGVAGGVTDDQHLVGTELGRGHGVPVGLGDHGGREAERDQRGVLPAAGAAGRPSCRARGPSSSPPPRRSPRSSAPLVKAAMASMKPTAVMAVSRPPRSRTLVRAFERTSRMCPPRNRSAS